MNDRPRDPIASGRPRGAIGWLCLLSALMFGSTAAFAVDVPPPTTPDSIPPGAPPAAAPAPGTVAPTDTLLGSRVLRIGMRGPDVKQFQRILRKRGFKVTPDGAFGSQTRRAVKSLQRRFKLPATGVVNKVLFTRLGIKLRGELSGTPSTPAPTGDYPLVGPNAAKAKYLKAFPVAGPHSYSNDWGAPRPQGTHQGNDIMANRNVPVRAVVAGSIKQMSRVETSRGGITIWLRDAAGNTFFYAHLDHIVDGLEVGSKVDLGQVLGGVGNTGDARGTVTHLHFEIHPGGGSAVNPYTDLRAVDPDVPAS